MAWIKKTFKFLGILLGILLVAAVAIYFIYNEPLPEVKKGEDASDLVEKIQKAINQTAWDNTHFVEWSFRGDHHYIWDKQRHLVSVKWGENTVLLNANNKTGVVYQDSVKLQDRGQINELVNTAYTYFINDAFWFNAPAQIAGDDRKLEVVKMPDSTNALLVTYLSGGVTPGDSYLWILDETGLPKAWKMWTSIIPVGGIETSWEEWTTLSTGAKVATKHDGGMLQIPIENIKAYQTMEEGKWQNDIFAELVNQ